MKRFNRIIMAAALLLSFAPVNSRAQKQLYTRSFSIQDFKSKTTKVVLGAGPELNECLRREITSFWAITPYEFCTEAEYQKQKNSSDCYFLFPETAKGIIYLTLARGGKESENDAFKRPVTVLTMPIGGENDPSGLQYVYMPAFISIIQDYVESSLNSEFSSYTGLKSICVRAPRGTKVIRDRKEADAAFLSQAPGTAVEIIISPDGGSRSKPRYKMVADCSSYALYSYAKH